MRSGANSVQHLLTPAALGVLKHAVAEARRRGHPQVQPLHVVSMLLTHAGSRLRQACMLSHPQNAQTAECRALEVCFNVALDHLPQSAMAMNGNSSSSNQQPPPILSNALMAALKRAHAHQRRGCPEHQQSPLLAVKVEVDQLIISILDDPSVSRVMKEAGFSSTNVKFNLEDGSSSTVTVATGAPSGHGEQHSVDVMSQVGSLSCVISDDNETKGTVKFTPKMAPIPANSITSWPQSEVSLQEVRETTTFRPSQAASAPGLHEDVETILDILLRARNRNAILVSDTTATANSTVEDLAVRIKNGAVPAQLQGLQFLDPKLSSSSFGYCSSLEMEQKLAELSKIVGECMPAGAILHIGDLQWLAEPMQLKKGPSNFCPAQRTAAELRQLLIRHANHRLWLVGVATPSVFARLQVMYPSLMSDWGLEPVEVPASFHPSRPAFLQRPAINSLKRNDQSALPMRTVASQDESTERFQCCADCLAKFEEERRFIHEKESLSLQLAPVKWFSLSSDEAASGCGNGPMITVKNRSVAQQLSQLQQIWQKRCRMLHGEPVSVLPLTSLPQQPRLQSPLSRLSASSHSKPGGLGLDISSSRWSGPDTSRQPQLASSVVDQPPRNVSCYTTVRELRVATPVVDVREPNAQSVEAAPDLGSPKDGSSVASAPEDHEDPNSSSDTSVQHASLAPVHTNLALGRANDGLNNKLLRVSPKFLNPSPLQQHQQKQHQHHQHQQQLQQQQQQPVGASPLSLKNSAKPSWMLQSMPTQQQRLVKKGSPWQLSSPLARRASLQVSKDPSPPPSVTTTPYKEFVVDETLKGLYKGLMQRVPWQATAVAGIAATVMKCRSGSGNFRGATAKSDTWLLLLGPDPVAKQAIAKALAELMFGGQRSLLHLGFGEGSVARLEAGENGVPYRGRTPIDRLVEAVRVKKSAVILLEDVDQANSTIRSSLVRAMEIGKLADSNGREVSVGNTIVVMTTSIGSEEMSAPKQPQRPGSFRFSEEKLASLGGLGKICGKIKARRSESESVVVFPAGNCSKVTVVDNGEKQQGEFGRGALLSLDVPSWVPKRKPENVQLRLRADAKRSRSGGDRRSLNLDLNLAMGGGSAEEEEEEDDDGCDSDEAKLQKVLAEARYALSHKFCALPDYAVGFNAFDFDALAVEVLDGLGNAFAAHAFSDAATALEVDVHLLEHLVACVWKTPGGRGAFHAWLDDVFAASVAATRIYRNSVVEFTAEDDAGGVATRALAMPHSVVFSSSAAAAAAV